MGRISRSSRYVIDVTGVINITGPDLFSLGELGGYNSVIRKNCKKEVF